MEPDPVDMTLPKGKKSTSSKKVSLAPTTTPQPLPDTPVDALIKDPVAFLKNSMQQEYNEKVAEKVTEAIRRDNTPPAKALQELSDAHKLAENIAKGAPAQPPPSATKSVKKAAETMMGPSSQPNLPDISAEAKEMMDTLKTYGRYRDFYGERMPELQWLSDAQFSRLNLIDMKTKLELARSAVNAASKKVNPVQTIFMIAIDAVTKISAAMAVAGVLEPSYDLSGQMTSGVNFKDVIKESVEKGELQSELEQIWVEYADSFNMGPFKRLAMAVMTAAQKVQEQNQKSVKVTTAPPKVVPKKMQDL